ncbi:MAG: protein kinase family protein [Verrucomicrobia bacterium]|nr:protein kinase family protein [Verrucomicrobiota bacterium]
MISPSSSSRTPEQHQPVPKQSKNGNQLHKKIVPSKASGERFPFFKTWNYVKALKKSGTYDTAVSLLGFNPSSRFSNFFALRKLIQNVGLEQIRFIVNSGLDSPTLENAPTVITHIEEVQSRLKNDNVASKVNDIRMRILDSVPDYKEEKQKQLTEALQKLGMDSTLADGIISNDKDTCYQVLTDLYSKAIAIGYTDSGTRSLQTLGELFAGGLEDKVTALTLVADQYSARDIQVKVLGELFTKVPQTVLEEAVKAHYQPELPTKIDIPIGDSGLYKIYFLNEKGTIEVALKYRKADDIAGGFKTYRLTGTMAAVKDVACLEFDQSNIVPGMFDSEINYWNDQQDAKVRHIPLLYSYVPNKSLFCENLFDGLEYWKKASAEEKEALFTRTGPVLFEYLQDIEKLGLVHRDIKPDNLLLSKDAQKVYVTDFGLMAKKGQDIAGAGTEGYYAPECRRNARPAPSQDIYSAARTLVAIRYGTLEQIPWKNDAYDTLLKKMLSEDPTKRPTATEALTEWQNASTKPGLLKRLFG